MNDFDRMREHMVDTQIAARGVRDPAVLAAMRRVPRELFVPEPLREFAHDDTPLAIGSGQTISQPYVVAWMADALELGPDDRVLEVGTGSGYAAAVLSRIASAVYTIERHPELAEGAARDLEAAGFDNIRVRTGDGTLGWPEEAPFDAILVSAGGPDVPASLLAQLAPGGRLVIPVGPTPRLQELVRLRRTPEGTVRETLGRVQFVPLIGAEGWESPRPITPARARGTHSIAHLVRESAEPISGIDDADLGGLLERIGDAKVVLLGEATHGTSEFYRMRTRITTELVTRLGFNVVAVEADWPDAARLDAYVRGFPRPEGRLPFTRFPTWMWRNEDVVELVEWLRAHNEVVRDPARQVSFHGLDIYSMHASIEQVLRYLDDTDPEAAAIARRRYACLSPWESDPATYGRLVTAGRLRSCEPAVVKMLKDLLASRFERAVGDERRFFDAVQNARVVAGAEAYYRSMYYGDRESWNLRDTHMSDTLRLLLAHRGPTAKAIVWAHNSHVGDAAATEMGVRGELNIGRLCKAEYGERAFAVGFGTDRGTVAAASNWDEPMQVMRVRPSVAGSYERLCNEAGVPAFLLHLRHPTREAVRGELTQPMLERAIGVVYRPETELASHYFQASLPHQFDEYVYFDETHAVTPLAPMEARDGVPETYPFGL